MRKQKLSADGYFHQLTTVIYAFGIVVLISQSSDDERGGIDEWGLADGTSIRNGCKVLMYVSHVCCNGRTQGDVVGGEEVEPNCAAG